MMALYRLVLLFVLLNVVDSEPVDVTVKSEAGTFIGFSETVEINDRNVTVSKFLGIPYAEPPIGDLRFSKTSLKAPLTEPLKVQKFGSACLQFYFIFPVGENDSEDCLFLNIFKPEVESEEAKLPVMVWIHGGGFVVGSSDPYIGDSLATNGPVIVVTLNYRLSLWGFLSTGDSNAPGNYGLWDQHMAIKWVHQNIESFGGDSTRVTIFGESAGAGSVVFQGLFPGNQGLFQRIIAQSGSAASQWATTPNAKSDASHLASLVGCDANDMKAMVECLRNLPAETLNDTLNNMTNWKLAIPFPFVPSVGDEFVPVLPVDIFDVSGNTRPDLKELFSSFELIIGLNSGEGGSAVNPYAGIDTTPENFLPNKTFFDQTLVPTLAKMVFGDDVSDIVNDAIVAEYTDWDDPENPETIRQMFCDMNGDYGMLGSTYRTLNAHAALSNQRTYQYFFNLLPYKSAFPRPTWLQKALHGDDLIFVFDNMMDLVIPGFAEHRELQHWEKKAAQNIMTLWTNFASTGNPNTPRDIGVDWLPYTPKQHRYLELSNDVKSSKVKHRLRERLAVFWDILLPRIIKATKCKNKYQTEGTCSREKNCEP